MRAPSNLLYDVQPAYERFVGLAGIDDSPFRERPPYAGFLAMHASVQFRVYIDGTLVAESPLMRISQEPWRFDVPIPKGSRRINLVITDAGSPSDWVSPVSRFTRTIAAALEPACKRTQPSSVASTKS